MPTVRLTARGVSGLEADRAQVDYWDDLLPGFGVRVSGTTGRKSYFVRYRQNGRQRRMTLGQHPVLSLADAREKARDVMGRAAMGEDPQEEKDERRRGTNTFEVLAEEVLEARARKGRGGKPTRPTTQRERRRLLEKELLPQWEGRPVDSITRRDVVTLVEGIAKRGAPTVANRTLSLVQLMFNDGLRRGFPTLEANPAHMVEPPGVEGSRDRFLTKDELPKVWQAVDDSPLLTKAAARLCLLTAQRIGAVCAMRWEDVTGDLWRIPEHQFKGKRPHLVPLSPEALDVLEELRPLTGDGEWAFPSREGSKKPHVANLSSSTLQRLRKEAGIPHWTWHDFRTTFRTHALRPRQSSRKDEPAGLGVEPRVADAVLGHKEQSVGVRHYQGEVERMYLSEKREALRRWGRFVQDAVEVSHD